MRIDRCRLCTYDVGMHAFEELLGKGSDQDREDTSPYVPEHTCDLPAGPLPQTQSPKIGNRFTVLVLVLARRQIVQQWLANNHPSIIIWEKNVDT